MSLRDRHAHHHVTDREEGALLDAYWTDLAREGDAVPPAGLDPAVAVVARRLTREVRIPGPDPAFVARLQRELAAQAAPTRPARWVPHRAWPPRGAALLAAAAALALVLAGTLLVFSRPKPVSAQTIVRQALTTATTAAALHSFVATEEARLWPAQGYPAFGYAPDDVVRSTLVRSFVAPNRWRVEAASTARLHTTTAPLTVLATPGVFVSNGLTVTTYCAPCDTVTVQPYSGQRGPGDLSPLGPTLSGAGAPGDLAALLQQARVCYTPRRLADGTVAGRAAYVVALTPVQCFSASAAEENGRRVLWVDQRTFVVLKSVLYSVYDPAQVFQEATITSIRYDVPRAATLFAYTPPLGARVLLPARGGTAAAAAGVGTQGAALGRIAARAGFPVLVPRAQLWGLHLAPPQITAGGGVALAYVAGGAAAVPVPAESVVIAESRATAAAARDTPHAQRVLIDGPGSAATAGWYVPGARGAPNTLRLVAGTVSLRLSSGLLARVGLVALAGSLAPLAPAPQATAPSAGAVPRPRATPPPPRATPTPAGHRQGHDDLFALRARLPFALFVPTYVPAGLTPLAPTLQGQIVQIDYQAPSGQIALNVLEGPAGCCLDADPRKGGRLLRLAAGRTAHLLAGGAAGGILWWEQGDTYVALSSAALPVGEQTRIAASLSPTAGLGRSRAAPRPTPTPAVTFRVLRPASLPEPMDQREQIQPGLPGMPATVLLTYTPRAKDWDHAFTGMTLLETPQTGQGGAVDDPTATHERIGGRDVTVVHRAVAGQGAACTMLVWVQRGVALALTNAYQPGATLRYTCAQLRAVVAAVR